MAITSAPDLDIALPDTPDGPVRYTCADGSALAPRDTEAAPADLAAAALWQRVWARWHEARSVLDGAAARLGEWLLGPAAQTYLAQRLRAWRTGDPALRVVLHVPEPLSEWPWELAALPGLGPLGIRKELSLVRAAVSPHPVPERPGSRVFVNLVCGDPSLPGACAELEEVRSLLEERSCFVPCVDLLGRWQPWAAAVEQAPADVVHFVGHGLEGGRGLYFRGEQDRALKVGAEQLAQVLGRRTRLAYLSACSTAANQANPLHPFGGLARRLAAHGVRAVVGNSAPVCDAEAFSLARVFYREVGHGAKLDCALQTARRELHQEGGPRAAWAFAQLTARADSLGPLWQRPRRHAAPPSPHRLWDFAHQPQRHRLERLLDRRRPLVGIVHGATRSGQRRFLDRVQHDMERRGNALWRPVTELSWEACGDPHLGRNALAGALADALRLSSAGALPELEARIARGLAERCRDGRFHILDFHRVLAPSQEFEVQAVRTLVHELWPDVLERAQRERDELPVFLLLSLAHGSGDRAAWTRALVSELRGTPRPRPRVGLRVEVVDELGPIGRDEVLDFLDTLDVPPAEAERRAQRLLASPDNEDMIERMRNLLWDLER